MSEREAWIVEIELSAAINQIARMKQVRDDLVSACKAGLQRLAEADICPKTQTLMADEIKKAGGE